MGLQLQRVLQVDPLAGDQWLVCGQPSHPVSGRHPRGVKPRLGAGYVAPSDIGSKRTGASVPPSDTIAATCHNLVLVGFNDPLRVVHGIIVGQRASDHAD